MILYEVFPNKTLKIREDENTYITENLISSVHIKLPSTFGDYPVKELTAELRFYFPEGDYMAYAVDTQQARPEVPITNDITEKPQTLSVMLFFYKGGNVIGKTNSVDKVILDAPLKGEPLTPRAEFDEVIAEQRETIAEQANTITEQVETISSQGEQITELSGEVTELTTENTRLENLTETQRETIQYMVDNPPSLEYPDNPVIPTRQAQTIRPTLPFYGIGRLEVDGYTPNNQNKIVTPKSTAQTITAGEGYDGLGEVIVEGVELPPLGGIFITEATENGYPIKYKVSNYMRVNSQFQAIYDNSGITYIKEFIFENCPNIKTIEQNTFRGLTNLEKMILPINLTALPAWLFLNCIKLNTINIPASINEISSYNPFNGCTGLENVTIENGFNCNNLNLSSSTRFTSETIVACLEALADRTGQTAYTITFGTTNLNKLTAEQKAIAINKNWNLA